MKSFTPQQIKDVQAEQLARDILRAKEVGEVVKKTNSALAKSQADFTTMLAGQRARWAREAEEHDIQVKEMIAEITQLETRKREALIPIEVYKKQADVLMATAKDILNKAKEKEEENEDLRERLEVKLTDVGAREEAVKIEEIKQRKALDGIELQKKSTSEGISKLNQVIADFTKVKESAEKEISEKKTALVLWDRTLLATKESYETKFKELNEWAIRLADERETLARAWKEISR